MVARLNTWWQQIKTHRITIQIGAIFLVLVIALIIVGYWFEWTGFAGKTLWDWLGLLASLAIPIVVGFGAIWFSNQQNQTSMLIAEHQQEETTLKTCLDDLKDLLLHEGLGTSQKLDDDVRIVARAEVLSALRQLDGEHKGRLVRFLLEAKLIILRNGKDVVFDLALADLRGAQLNNELLSGAMLGPVDLSGADLRNAGLVGTYLAFANLTNVNLTNADLSGAILTGANLTGASVTTEQLGKAKSLKGATMTDGSIYP
jgi:hypothetical protein